MIDYRVGRALGASATQSLMDTAEFPLQLVQVPTISQFLKQRFAQGRTRDGLLQEFWHEPAPDQKVGLREIRHFDHSQAA
jgi:hypothetical protein